MPDPYVKQTWNNGVAGATPLSAARLQYMEDGIENATVPDGTYEQGDTKRIYVSPAGNDARPGLLASAPKQTISAALTAMGTERGVIELLAGTHLVTGSLAWPAVATCGMVGLRPEATVIQAVEQTGPVLDLTAVGYGLNRSEFGGFTLKGDGTAGSAKKGLALSSSTSMVSAYIHDIVVSDTGGACFDLGNAELCDFDRLSAIEPVSAAANDIPYVVASGAFNGNNISRLSLAAPQVVTANVGASGAVIIRDNGVTAPHSNKIDAPKIQGLKLPAGATIFAIAGNRNTISDIQHFDDGQVTSVTGTSYVRFSAPAVTDVGGNLVRGYIPGRSTGGNAIQWGVDVLQSRNFITGVKGFNGYNVRIAVGITHTTVAFGGSNGTVTNPPWENNSSAASNSLLDGVDRIQYVGGGWTFSGDRLLVAKNGVENIQLNASTWSGPAARITASVSNNPAVQARAHSSHSNSIAVLEVVNSAGAQLFAIRNGGVAALPLLPTYADNAAAVSGGLAAGDIYKTATGELRIRV